MSPKKELTALRLRRELLTAMRHIRETERIGITAQIELAVEAWLKARGTVVEKPGRTRAGTRPRPVSRNRRR